MVSSTSVTSSSSELLISCLISAQSVDRFQYQLFMLEYTGGVAAITSDQYQAINGFSNLYLGWGCEDEDFYVRIVDRGLTLIRVDVRVSFLTI